MTVEEGVAVLKAVADLIGVIIWPAVLVFLFLRFSGPIREFLGGLGELTFKAAGVEASAKRRQVEAAAALGAAVASRSPGAGQTPEGTAEDAREIASLVSDSATPDLLRRFDRATVLWVDDRPENNANERRALQALGIDFVLSTSTEDALGRTTLRPFDAVISDMGRPPDPRAGYTLLDALRQRGDQTPFVIYAGSNAPEHKVEARQHGALGSTNRAQELFQLVVDAIRYSPPRGLGGGAAKHG